MSDTRPPWIYLHKALLLVAFFFLFGLSACNPSWVNDPLAKYLKNKTGIEIKIEGISFGLHPLLVESKGIQMRYKKDPVSWEVKIPELRVVLDWTLSWEELPWPKVHIEKITLNRPTFLIRMPQPREAGDWTVWLKKFPILKQIEVTHLQGRVEIGEMAFQLAPETWIKASFSPDQGGKIEYQIKSLQGLWPSKGIQFKTKSQGTFELYDLQDQPKWKGKLNVFDGNLLSKTGKVAQASGAFSFRYKDHILEISAAPARVKKIDWNGTKASFSGQGNLALAGTLRHQKTGKKAWLLSGIHIKFDEFDFNFEQGNRLIKGRTEGQARLHGPLLTPTINARLSTRQMEMDLPPVFTHGLETEIDVQGRFPLFSFPVVRARAAQTDWQLSLGPLSIINPETRFSALIKTNTRQIFLNDITLKTENWSSLSGSLLFDLNKSLAPEGKARGGNFPLLKFFKHFFPNINEPFSDEIPCQGTIEWARETAGSPIDFLVSITPVPFSLQFPETDWEGEDLTAQIQGRGKWFFKEKTVQLDLKHTLFKGSLSRTPWIFNFDRYPLQGRFEATIDGRKQTGSIMGSLGLQYGPLGEITVSGDWPFRASPFSYSGSIEVNNLPLEKGFPLLIGEPLGDDYPFWKQVSLQGLLNARLSLLKKKGSYDLKGRINGFGIGAALQDSAFSIQKGSLDLPFYFSSPDADPGERESSQSGFIAVEHFQGFRLDLKNLHFSILAGNNRFEIPEKIAVPLWGGQVSLNFFKVSNPLGDWKMETALSLKDLDLVQMFQDQEITGTLQGDLGPIRIDKEKARIEGTLKANVFEGTVEGKNLAITEPFAPERGIQGELFFNHLNLEPVTQRLSFGKITGFVQGRVMDLLVRRNRPERFHLQVNTQEIPGVPKIINIKAIENIGLLGTGWGELDVLRKGINRFISEYSYRAIGLSCTLEEDLFHLHGTIIEDGVEYLVRKPDWFGIDVINKNPDNEILFSDILERIRSIKKKPQERTGDEIK
jgi:hypothetical protein